jgi:predicted MFS family arabinose efflux permease
MDQLHINTVQMGLFTMAYPLGGLIGVGFSSGLVARFGSKTVTVGIYSVAGAAMVALGETINGGNLVLASVLLLLVGLPMSIADFVGNYEGSLADKASTRSLFSAIHGAFGLGMLLGAELSSRAIKAQVSLTEHFAAVAIVVALGAYACAAVLPRHPRDHVSAESKRRARSQFRKAWTEPRSLAIALVGFSFIMAETSANTWVPIALTDNGFSPAKAASALGLFWVLVTLFRLLGGAIVDAIGRWYTILASALVTAAGVALFMLVNVVELPYLALVLWGAGMAIGFPMSVNAMGDDPVMAPARINMIVTVVYISSMSVGPALGALGQAAGIYTAFGIPLVVLLVAAALSKVTKPAT